jgi:hypothetical protein
MQARRFAHATWLGATALGAIALACSGDHTPEPPADTGPPRVPVRPDDGGDVATQLALARAFDAESIADAYRVPFSNELGYSPGNALGLDTIQSSALALAFNELDALERNGFVIVRRHAYPSFAYAYASIYAEDLPVFISADMVLEALHRSYDAILRRLEQELLSPTLATLLGSMRERLAGAEVTLSEQTRADLDVYLTVAESLLAGTLQSPVASGPRADVEGLFLSVEAASGQAVHTLFGDVREIDFSVFEPRGHYQGDAALEPYFRAMTWLGRIDFRLLENQGDNTRTLQRRQVEAALGLRALLDDAGMAAWSTIDHVIGTFVGAQEAMFLPQLDELLGKLDVNNLSELGNVSDLAIEQAIRVNHYGEPRRVASFAASGEVSNNSFALFGQRNTVDDAVFENLIQIGVSSRVQPNPLDAAFAALGNDQAIDLLSNELSRYAYAGELAAARVLVDNEPAEYWSSSLYAAWLGALRSLSPAPREALSQSGLPAVARTQAWGRRVLNTQLGSWAELRHDTLLYAKETYTTGSTCEFPDAYVDPYPVFFFQLARYGERGQEMVSQLRAPEGNQQLLSEISAYFANLTRVTTILGQMAEHQLTGAPHAPEHIAFINQAIRLQPGASGPPFQEGWYRELFFDANAVLEADPTIADVHADPGGDAPFLRGPSVLHVATGLPRLMVATLDTCAGPRAYAGAVFSYYERVTPGTDRLTDADWVQVLAELPPADVPWLRPVLAD